MRRQYRNKGSAKTATYSPLVDNSVSFFEIEVNSGVSDITFKIGELIPQMTTEKRLVKPTSYLVELTSNSITDPAVSVQFSVPDAINASPLAITPAGSSYGITTIPHRTVGYSLNPTKMLRLNIPFRPPFWYVDDSIIALNARFLSTSNTTLIMTVTTRYKLPIDLIGEQPALLKVPDQEDSDHESYSHPTKHTVQIPATKKGPR